MSGRVLVRFLQAAQEANSQDQISTLRTELEFVQWVQSVSSVVTINLFRTIYRLAINKVGERIPLACTFLFVYERCSSFWLRKQDMHAKLLYNATVDTCGPSIGLSGSDSMSPPQETPNPPAFGSSPMLNTIPIVSWWFPFSNKVEQCSISI